MMENKIAVCPICGKRTWLRIQNGGYLSEYPVRVNCMNCRALLKGAFVMESRTKKMGLQMVNATIEECDMQTEPFGVRNADYVAEISGELPCENVKPYDGGLPLSPFMKTVDSVENMQGRIERLTYFTANMQDWRSKKSTAFQLLDEGSIEYIATALNNKMGNYRYECDNYLKSLQCLQEVVQEETKYLYLSPDQDSYIVSVIQTLSHVDKEQLHQLATRMGGIQGIILAYRKAIEVFSEFMSIYPNLLPAETFIRYRNPEKATVGIATCSFGDLKTFYQDAYESLLSLLYIPICIDNIVVRSDYMTFSNAYKGLFKQKKFSELEDDFQRYTILDNGMKLGKIDSSEAMQGFVNIPGNRFLRNGIGHNNIKYDGISQIITAFDLKDHNKINLTLSLMEMAVDCIGLAKSAVVMSEILLFLLRKEFRTEGVRSIIHPRFYKNAEPNGKCPCGSDIKYKKCCKNDLEQLSRTIT